IQKWFQIGYESYDSLYLWLVFTAILPLVYSIVCHYRTGQTIGKWVTGIRVVDVSETRKLTLGQAIARDSVVLGIEIMGILYCLYLLFSTADPGYIVSEFDAFTYWPFFIWSILELITLFSNKKKRALHDYLAKSVVVRTFEK
ncbi:MAG: RDD family protein, partial [Flavitalea sp.]